MYKGSSPTNNGSSATHKGSSATHKGSSATDKGSSATDKGSSATDRGSCATRKGSSATRGAPANSYGLNQLSGACECDINELHLMQPSALFVELVLPRASHRWGPEIVYHISGPMDVLRHGLPDCQATATCVHNVLQHSHLRRMLKRSLPQFDLDECDPDAWTDSHASTPLQNITGKWRICRFWMRWDWEHSVCTFANPLCTTA